VETDILQAMGDLDALVRTALAQRYQARNEDATPAMVRSWVLDALESADLSEWPSGRTLLTLYYLDRKEPTKLWRSDSMCPALPTFEVTAEPSRFWAKLSGNTCDQMAAKT